MRWKIERNSDGSFSVFCNLDYIEEYERAFKAVVNELIDNKIAISDGILYEPREDDDK